MRGATLHRQRQETTGRDVAVRCRCGAHMVDAMNDQEVVVGGTRYPFRRHTDHVICPQCLFSYRVIDLRDA